MTLIAITVIELPGMKSLLYVVIILLASVNFSGNAIMAGVMKPRILAVKPRAEKHLTKINAANITNATNPELRSNSAPVPNAK